jgi:hypothetical protein
MIMMNTRANGDIMQVFIQERESDSNLITSQKGKKKKKSSGNQNTSGSKYTTVFS